jgi:hypothetical protein
MTLKPDQQAKKFRSEVFRHMCETRGWKYRVFLRYLLFFKYIAFAPTRGEFLESYYTLMRYLDDVVDGDLPLPKSYANESEYLSEKIEFSKNPIEPKDEIDSLMMYCFKLAEEFGEDFHAETSDILDALQFDAKRRGKGIIFPREELFFHFHLLDVRGTIRATLKVFKDDPDKYKILEPLGIACRHQYNIEDFEADITAGYINISLEDFERFGIRQEDLHNSSSPAIISWLRHHAREGLSLLIEHNRILPQGNFSLLEKAVFKVVYELPARKVFLKFLSRTQNQDSEKKYE